MAYCTQADLESRIGAVALAELTNDTAGTVKADPTVVSDIISSADSIIDALMTNVYLTPFSPVPKIIKECSIRLAIHNAFGRRFSTMEEPKQWIEAEKKAQEWLSLIANLEMTLDTAPSVTGAESAIVSPARDIDFTDEDNAVSLY